jgi:segregation and condensation protein A
MASTLAHIKSRLLLPRQEAQGEVEPEEQGDPRAELVRRLLEYQKYKEAAETLARQDILDRDVFPRRVHHEQIPLEEGEVGLREISVFKLIEALDRVLRTASEEIKHEVTRERVSLSDAIHRIADRLRAEGKVGFFSLFEGQRQRHQIVITFLALLEMAKLRLVRIHQEEGEEIVISARGDALASLEATEVDEREYR